LKQGYFMLLKSWIIFCSVFVAAGWLLSAAHQLNGGGYAVATTVAVLAVAATLGKRPVRWRLPTRRFRQSLPFAFLLLGFAAFLGGALHPPNNYDALTSSLPRLHQWLAAGRWHWITTTNERMNFSAANFEWLTAPVLIFSRSDRLLFLLNFLPYLLLPGLLFSTYRMLRVPGRVAWAWMWILPAAYCYALQAGSISNGAIGAVLVLASLQFGLRASRTKQMLDACLALLAIALATGIEASNLPLVLPCLVALWPARHILIGRPLTATAALAAALLVSYLPSATLNRHFTGSWRGYGPYTIARLVHHPVAGILATSLRVGAQTLQPPLCPTARALDARLTGMLPERIKGLLKPDFPQLELAIGELPQEEVSGLGLGVVLLLLTSLVARFLVRDSISATVVAEQNGAETWVIAAVVLALFLYRSPPGCEPTARSLSPYFPLVLPLVLAHAANSRLVRNRWWQWAALLVIASATLVVILTPARPLWPADTVLAKLQSRWPEAWQLARLKEVFSVYRGRNELLKPLRDCLPPDAVRVGVITGPDDADYALWRPFGTRRLNYLVGARPWDEETRGLTWVVGKTDLVKERYRSSLEQFRLSRGGRIVAIRRITSKVRDGPEEWFVMQLVEGDERHVMGARE
jgi:hypothetical protein